MLYMRKKVVIMKVVNLDFAGFYAKRMNICNIGAFTREEL